MLNEKEIDEVFAVLVDKIQDLYEGRVSYEDLAITKSVGIYLSELYAIKVFTDRLKKAGKPIKVGDRISFVVIKDPNATLLGQRMRSLEEYLEGSEELDYEHYAKLMINRIDPLFEKHYKFITDKLSNVIYYKESPRHRIISLNNPIRLIMGVRSEGLDLNLLKDSVRTEYQKYKNKV
ncbi:DNA polymerase family B [uncultured virus]|nr:DNA polymerase family B [uncultured virus]